jgi:hypothetical protein
MNNDSNKFTDDLISLPPPAKIHFPITLGAIKNVCVCVHKMSKFNVVRATTTTTTMKKKWSQRGNILLCQN